MRKHTVLLLIALSAFGALLSACRRSDMHSVVISVPHMSDARAIRIVTNAALDEVVGRYDGIKSDYEIDLAQSVVLYHESARLGDQQYQRRIESRLAEVGYESQVLAVGRNPPPLVPTKDGPCQMWPDRITARIRVPQMKTVRDANVVVAAIAYARLGGDSPHVAADPRTRSLSVRYESLTLSPRSIELAISCSGYAANTTPADLGRENGTPHGWQPVRL